MEELTLSVYQMIIKTLKIVVIEYRNYRGIISSGFQKLVDFKDDHHCHKFPNTQWVTPIIIKQNQKNAYYIKRNLIIEKLEKDPFGSSSLELALRLQIPKSTFFRWRREGMKKRDGRGGESNSKLTENHINYMVQTIETDPLLTLKEFTDKI